jgi:hypothetical protein
MGRLGRPGVRINRKYRNRIEERFGIGAVDEVERWNDGALDPLDDFGVELPLGEEVAQQAALASLTARRAA